MTRNLPRHVVDALSARQERIAAPEDGQRRDRDLQQSFERGELCHGGEQPQRVDRTETHVVWHRDPGHPRALADSVDRELQDGPSQRAVVDPARRRDEDDAVDPVRVPVRRLEADRAPHGVPDKDGPVDLEGVEDLHERIGEARDGQGTGRLLTTAVAGQVGNDIARPAGEQSCCGHEVGAGDPESVHMDDRDGASVDGRCANDGPSTIDVDVVERPTRVDPARHGGSVAAGWARALDHRRRRT